MCSLAKSRLFCAVGGKDLGDIYQALYRKYRPRTFDEVCGQEHITETLKAQVASGRLSHAYLFVGTRGTGKTTCAKILAKAVNCLHPVNGDPCGECAACRGIDEGSVLDVVEIDAASNNGVENVRALRDEAVFSPASVKKRVYIIDEVHMLSTAAFNALLKILEEPPEHLMFILATTELRKVPGTILSRCQRYSFRRLDADVIAKRLNYIAARAGFKLTEGGSALIARLADGGMRDAISLLDQCSGAPVIDEDAITESLGLAGGRRTAELLSAAARHDAKSALDAFAALWRDGKAALALFGSTSPSYLTLASLDLCNRRLAEGYGAELRRCVRDLDGLRRTLRDRGWQVLPGTDPLRLTLAAPEGLTGLELADRLRRGGVECEYADPEFTVLMATPDNAPEDLDRVAEALGENTAPPSRRLPLPPARGERVCSVRQALFAPHRTVAAAESLGRVCGAPTVACPPAIPIAVSGERIGPEALALFAHYGVETVDILE